MDYRGETFKGISEKGEREKQGVYVRAKNLLGEQESESIFPGHPLFPLQHPICLLYTSDAADDPRVV